MKFMSVINLLIVAWALLLEIKISLVKKVILYYLALINKLYSGFTGPKCQGCDTFGELSGFKYTLHKIGGECLRC